MEENAELIERLRGGPGAYWSPDDIVKLNEGLRLYGRDYYKICDHLGGKKE